MSPINVLEFGGRKEEQNKKFFTKASIARTVILSALVLGLGLGLWQVNTIQEIKRSKAEEINETGMGGGEKKWWRITPTPTGSMKATLTPTPRPPRATPTPTGTQRAPTPTPTRIPTPTSTKVTSTPTPRPPTATPTPIGTRVSTPTPTPRPPTPTPTPRRY